jgi:hypothetical protein
MVIAFNLLMKIENESIVRVLMTNKILMAPFVILGIPYLMMGILERKGKKIPYHIYFTFALFVCLFLVIVPFQVVKMVSNKSQITFDFILHRIIYIICLASSLINNRVQGTKHDDTE